MLFTWSKRIDFLAVPIFQTRKCFWLTVSKIRSTWNMWKRRISLICESVCQYNNRYVKEWDYGQKTCSKTNVFFHLIFISGSSEALILLSDWKREDSKWLGHTLQKEEKHFPDCSHFRPQWRFKLLLSHFFFGIRIHLTTQWATVKTK